LQNAKQFCRCSAELAFVTLSHPAMKLLHSSARGYLPQQVAWESSPVIQVA
jgi:hypothetical protein